MTSEWKSAEDYSPPKGSLVLCFDRGCGQQYVAEFSKFGVWEQLERAAKRIRDIAVERGIS